MQPASSASVVVIFSQPTVTSSDSTWSRSVSAKQINNILLETQTLRRFGSQGLDHSDTHKKQQQSRNHTRADNRSHLSFPLSVCRLLQEEHNKNGINNNKTSRQQQATQPRHHQPAKTEEGSSKSITYRTRKRHISSHRTKTCHLPPITRAQPHNRD